RDPIRFEGGTPNLYEYANGDPVNLVDPSGHGILERLLDLLKHLLSGPSSCNVDEPKKKACNSTEWCRNQQDGCFNTCKKQRCYYCCMEQFRSCDNCGPYNFLTLCKQFN